MHTNTNDSIRVARRPGWWDKLKPRLEQHLRNKLKRQSERETDLCGYEELRVLLKAELGEEGEKLARTLKGKKQVAPVRIPALEVFFRRYDLLLKLGGELDWVSVAFGNKINAHSAKHLQQMIFEPTLDGKMKVKFSNFSPDPDALKAALNSRTNRLWDKEKDQPGAEYRAIAYADDISKQLRPIVEAIQKRQDLSVFQHDMPRLWQIDSALADLLQCVRHRNAGKRAGRAGEIYLQFASATQSDDSKFFDSPYESEIVKHLKGAALALALQFQRPPAMSELREQIGWGKKRGIKAQWRLAEFKKHLLNAGLGWLPTDLKLKQLGL
jgi:hypothetical protein